jgi:hypothetical protein|tara:strand:+ start:198 stop:305 length:108 start_codon:yes stop_codon:yes gene_type:complete
MDFIINALYVTAGIGLALVVARLLLVVGLKMLEKR